MSRVPRIRFKGFEEDWEQRKLVRLCEKFTDGDWIESKDQSNFGVRLIQTGNIGLGEYIDKSNNKKWISEETFGRLNCEEVFAGDILISRLPEPAGRACIVPSLGTKIIAAVDCTIVRVATQINSKYLLQYLSSQSYFDDVNTCLAGGTRQRISRSNLADFNIPIPANYEEQKAIGEFLFCLDHLITLHQRKLEKLKIIKKSMLEHLFSKNGEKTPKIRFSGFTKDWEQRKLGEIADKVVEKNFQLQERDVFTNSAEFGIIDQKDFFDHEIVNKNNIGGYYIVSPNDFVYNPRISVTAPVGPINRNKLCKRGIMSPLYTVFHPRNMNETFLEFYFKTNKWHKFMEYNGDSGARSDRFSIKTELFYAMTIPFPSREEQSKVGICFESINHLITLHQSKLEKLQKIKKSMLESMFV
ncbi:restriction endonuclease subunit S [Lachnoanaerobaculum orale]|uniref:Restriction endonuclease subunit S n=1 Tax=Lachnoanaerobaculum orale TaxID=979627 RepID=A0A3P3Q5M7_9FIRM|nr:restriction endonuclease subunit S [Lachnoanaerobaculum orale]RRJ16491.1 restriction endonuclease subunit S [Lachnoanaerobaculum orale]